MRVITTASFSQWLMANSAVYPYSNIYGTRNSFFCKWVMVKGEDLDREEYFPVPANSLPNGVLLDLVTSGFGKPLPPDISEIMDTLFVGEGSRTICGMMNPLRSLEMLCGMWKKWNTSTLLGL
jgi:hypothetical protein